MQIYLDYLLISGYISNHESQSEETIRIKRSPIKTKHQNNNNATATKDGQTQSCIKNELFETDGIKIEVDSVVVIENEQVFPSNIGLDDKIDENVIVVEHEQEANPIECKDNHEGSIKSENLEHEAYEAKNDDLDDNEINDLEPNLDESNLKNDEQNPIKIEEESTEKEKNKSRKKVKKFRCLVCNKIPFGMKLKEHIIENHGEGPYECILCNDEIPTIKGLREHRWKHYSKELVECKV